MGTFYPLVARALGGVPGKPAPGPYAVAFFFAVGVLLSTVPANLLLMAKPLDGKPPVDGAGYRSAPMSWHIAGVLGGAIWCTGAVANFVASGAHLVGPAVSYYHRPGRDHGLGLLGSFCVARVCRRAPLGQNSVALHVHLLRTGAERGCAGSVCPGLTEAVNTMQKTIVVVGSINMDLVARASEIPRPGQSLVGTGFDTTPGGKGANQAVAAARLGYLVQMVGAVGEDVFGTALLDNLNNAGVRTAAVKRVDGPSGVATILVAENGENSIVVVPGANGKVDPAVR